MASAELNPRAASVQDGFEPGRYETFRFTSYDFDEATGTAALNYALDEGIEFQELVRFPGARLDGGVEEAFDRCLALLHMVAGVSYFKVSAPPRIEVESAPLTSAAAELLSTLYSNGLAEFAWTNGLDLSSHRWFSATTGSEGRPPAPASRSRRTLVPIGGGKDSVVSVELLKSIDEPMALFSIGDARPIRATAEVAGVERRVVERVLSPNLVPLNHAGAYNGHIPVTAVVSVIAVAAALLYDFDGVAMSNERSASTGSFHWQGMDVNHQWSKGIDFEAALSALLGSEIAEGISYFSLLRPASELSIARTFSRLPAYHQRFTSCNAVFRRDPKERSAAWCCDCPKCRFVFLALAPFLPVDRLRAIFGHDMLADPSQLPGFLALLGIDDEKPFECVGEIEESVAALSLLAHSEEWGRHEVVRALTDRVASSPSPLPDPTKVLELSSRHHIPDHLVEATFGYLGS